ncbi:MAG: CPBP family intramembrane glutamic endopeptidase [Candidatus Promineifilaceae bacterium]|nr:CPBP family intramembrane glutamic endopeptidase [Candidatus Promineifilaceae bacterium]
MTTQSPLSTAEVGSMDRLLRVKLFLVIWLLAMLGALAVLPYAFDAVPVQSVEQPLSQPELLFISLLQTGVILAIMIVVGLNLAPRVGLGAPFLVSWLNHEPTPKSWSKVLLLSIGVGVAAALLVIGLEFLYFSPAMAAIGTSFPANAQPPTWQSFLASFYGGITEEVMMRLFLMTLLVWLGSKVSYDRSGQPTTAVFWLAIVGTTIVFGLGHLPITLAMGVPLNGLIVTRAVVLNGLSLAFGWLYWKQGLESAMVAHFSADIVLHVIPKLLA